MAYCINCGQRLTDGAKFCANCGMPTTNDQTKRKTIYDGELHKCPNCGELLNSFTLACPSCGYELRGTNANNSVKELSYKLEQIEKTREHEPPSKSYISKLYGTDGKLSKTDEQKISLIRSFPIPNTKEDILEFMILASSNINFKLYGLGDKGVITASQREVSDAWFAKMEQVYEKAQLLFSNHPEFQKISRLYEKTNRKIKKKKREIVALIVFPFAFFLAMVLMVIIIEALPEPSLEKQIENRNEHLEYVVEQIEDDIAAGNFIDARNKAYTLTFDENLSDEYAIYWESKQQQILEQISIASNDQGYVSNPINESDFKAFVSGYEKATFSKFNSYASENGLEGTRIYIECTLDSIELFKEGDITAIGGYVTDNNGNAWIIEMHAVPLVPETYYDRIIGEEILLRGAYSGYSEVKGMPAITLDELLVKETGEILFGMQKLLE